MTLMDNKKLWDSALAEIELGVSGATFNTWFKNTNIANLQDGIVYLSVPNTFVKDWLVQKYHKTILKTLRGLADFVRAVEYIVSEKEMRKKITGAEKFSLAPTIELPLKEHYINKEDNLNPRYTFDTFIVGSFNELAHAASQAVIKKPLSYNPLFIYGGSGHGKTHLIQAIGNQIKTNSPDKKVFYITSEKFTTDYINSVQNQKMNDFKEKYRKYDVLIMDDIQFFSNTERTQDELFHLFNSLYDSNRQIIFSSDKHPNYIPNLEDRLKSRCVSGMIIDIPTPDHESRLSILRAKARFNNFFLADEIVEYLADSVAGSIRELEGALNVIVCQSQFKNKDLSLVEVKNLIKNTDKPKKSIAPKDVVKTIANFYNIEESSIYEKTRRKEIVRPRQIVMYVLRKDFNISFPSIGEKMGGRDHTTVIHSCEKIEEEMKNDTVLAQEVSQIRAMF